MDETTKVIIATISGFIISFMAEPVKIYFQNRSKLHALQFALYKEIFSNYINLKLMLPHMPNIEIMKTIKNHLRTECYKDALANDISLFYSLTESLTTNQLHSMLGTAMDLSQNTDEGSLQSFLEWCTSYTESIESGMYTGVYDPKLFKAIFSESKYQEIFNIGKEASRKKEAVLKKQARYAVH